MSLTFGVEKLYDFLPEVVAMSHAHWEEVAADKNAVPLDIDWQRYLELDANGTLLCIVARDEGKFAGYYTYLVHKPLRYKSSIFAECDVFYLAPDYRKGTAGMRLIRESEKFLKAYVGGPVRVITRTKLKRSGIEEAKQDLGPVFERLGYKPIERVYTKII